MDTKNNLMPRTDRNLEDFIFGFNISCNNATDALLNFNFSNIMNTLFKKINDCCVDDVKDIIKKTSSVFKILKTDLTKNDLYKLRCKNNKICLIWPHDKHPIYSSHAQVHIDNENINILKEFDIFIDPYKKVRSETGTIKDSSNSKKVIRHFEDNLKNCIENFNTKRNKNELNSKDFTLDEFFMSKAYQESKESIEPSRWVGAIIIDGENIISKGYNTYPKKNGETGSLSSKNRTNEVIHAEMDAILNALKEPESPFKNPHLYTTTFPCENCAKHIIHSGIKKVIYIEPYRKSKAEEFYTSFITLKDSGDDNSDNNNNNKKIPFLFFEGIGPRLVS